MFKPSILTMAFLIFAIYQTGLAQSEAGAGFLAFPPGSRANAMGGSPNRRGG